MAVACGYVVPMFPQTPRRRQGGRRVTQRVNGSPQGVKLSHLYDVALSRDEAYWGLIVMRVHVFGCVSGSVFLIEPHMVNGADTI